MFADDLRGAEPGDALRAVVPTADEALGIDRDDGVFDDAFHQQPEALLALPQVALVALDPHTGAIKALVGGRNYGESQLNRVFAKRQPGSTFKPFVYAAAMNLATTQKGGDMVTAGTRLIDEPTTFTFNNQPYQPANFEDKYLGSVTVRKALTNSLNIPTVKVAEKIGYQPVVDLARAAGRRFSDERRASSKNGGSDAMRSSACLMAAGRTTNARPMTRTKKPA